MREILTNCPLRDTRAFQRQRLFWTRFRFFIFVVAHALPVPNCRQTISTGSSVLFGPLWLENPAPDRFLFQFFYSVLTTPTNLLKAIIVEFLNLLFQPAGHAAFYQRHMNRVTRAEGLVQPG